MMPPLPPPLPPQQPCNYGGYYATPYHPGTFNYSGANGYVVQYGYVGNAACSMMLPPVPSDYAKNRKGISSRERRREARAPLNWGGRLN